MFVFLYYFFFVFIFFQAKRGWFSRSCVKVNHSRSRFSFLLPSVVNVWLNEEGRKLVVNPLSVILLLFDFFADSICQICVDDTRNILYTRSEKGTISVKFSSVGLMCFKSPKVVL